MRLNTLRAPARPWSLLSRAHALRAVVAPSTCTHDATGGRCGARYRALPRRTYSKAPVARRIQQGELQQPFSCIHGPQLLSAEMSAQVLRRSLLSSAWEAARSGIGAAASSLTRISSGAFSSTAEKNETKDTGVLLVHGKVKSIAIHAPKQRQYGEPSRVGSRTISAMLSAAASGPTISRCKWCGNAAFIASLAGPSVTLDPATLEVPNGHKVAGSCAIPSGGSAAQVRSAAPVAPIPRSPPASRRVQGPPRSRWCGSPSPRTARHP